MEHPHHTPPTNTEKQLIFMVSVPVAAEHRAAIGQTMRARLHALGDLALDGTATVREVTEVTFSSDPQYAEFQVYKQRQADAERLLTEAGLTENQRRITTLLKFGKSNREIADYLNVSMSTVKTHIDRIYRKTGIFDRYELAARLNGATEEEWNDPLGLRAQAQNAAMESSADDQDE